MIWGKFRRNPCPMQPSLLKSAGISIQRILMRKIRTLSHVKWSAFLHFIAYCQELKWINNMLFYLIDTHITLIFISMKENKHWFGFFFFFFFFGMLKTRSRVNKNDCRVCLIGVFGWKLQQYKHAWHPSWSPNPFVPAFVWGISISHLIHFVL
jgi:hypothetical protein